MANKKRPTPRPRAGGGARPPGSPLPPPTVPVVGAKPAPRSRTPWIVGIGVAAIVVIAAVIAIVASGGDDGDDAAATTVATTTATTNPDGSGPDGTSPDETPGGSVGPAPGSSVPPADPGEYQAVTATGTALPRLTDGADPAIGSTPPVLSGYGFDGTPITIDPSDGTPKMVVFLAHWCPHCNREVPRLVQWHADGGVPAELEVIGVSTGADDAAPNWPPSEWIADEAWPWPVMADDEQQTAAGTWGLPGYPYFVIVGADGTVKARQSGEIPIDDLEAIVTAALA